MNKLYFVAPLVLGGLGVSALFGSSHSSSKSVAACVSDSAKYQSSPLYQKTFKQTLESLKKAKASGTALYQACYAPGTPPEIIAAFEQAMRQVQGGGAWPATGGRSKDYFLGGTQWPSKNLTWSFVPDGTLVPGLSGANTASDLFAQMDSKFSAVGGRAFWMSKFEQIFARWSALSGHTYTRVRYNGNDWDDGAVFPNTAAAANTRGDIRIGGRNLDGASSVLAFNYYPTTGDMVVDTSESWGNSANDYLFLRNTLGHEHGHGLGIAHVCPLDHTKLMEPYLNTNFDGPMQDDVRACHQIYGDKYESNNTAATATPLGNAFAGGTGLSLGEELASRPANTTSLSLGNSTDVDYFTFNINRRAAVNVTVAPVGTNYQNGSQNSSTGACNASSAFDALAVRDLVLTIYSNDGTTVLANVNNTAAGVAETTRVILPNSGNYYAKVSTNGSATQSQMYKIGVLPEALKYLNFSTTLADLGAVAGQTATVEFRTPGTTTVLWSTTVSLTGSPMNLELDPLITPGTYDIALKGSHWGRVVSSNVSIGSSGASGVSFTAPINGDVNGDNTVNLTDFSQLSTAYGSSTGGSFWNAGADLNADGTINLVDFSILSRDYGKTGAN